MDVTTLTLSASPNAVAPGASSTLTADAHGYNVGPTPWYLEIYDTSTGGYVAICGTGTTCSASVSQGAPTTHSYRAYIANYSTTNPPGGIQATSNYVSVTWLSVSLGANTRWVPPGAGVTLTATANTNVGPTPWYLEIFDKSTGGSVAICATGSSCSASVSQPSATTHSYVAYVSGYGTRNPPPSVQATSSSVAVTWLAVSLGASATVLLPGGTTTLTASANTDVGPSPYYIEIFDTTSGARVAVCGTGSSCSTNVTQSSTFRNYVAYIALSGTTNPPPGVQVSSNTVLVSWLSVSLSANPTILAPRAATTLTATASQDVGSTPYYIEIFDHTTHAFLVSCPTGITCSTSVAQSSGTIHNFIAYISAYGTSEPPSNNRATSNVVAVTWLAVSLKTSSTVVGSGATVTLTATANANVSGTPYWVEIFDQSYSPSYLNACGSGAGTSTVCTATSPSHTVGGGAGQSKLITDNFIAYVTSQLSTVLPPQGIQATSNVVSTSWSWEDCNNEGGIWMMVSSPQPTGTGNKGEIQNYDRTLAGCGALNTIGWSTVGISPDSSLGTWVETGWTLSYNVIGQHYRWWFTEWGINYTGQGRDSNGPDCPSTGTFSWWRVENTGADSWTGYVDCEDGAGWRALHTYTGTGFTSGIGWSEAGRHGGTGTSLEDYHRNLQYKDSTGAWTNWPGMTCQNDIASNWNWVTLSANSWKSQQGVPTC